MLNINIILGGSIGTNSYLLEDNKKVLLIDFVPQIEKVIIENNFNLESIILTHTHYDHLEGLSAFQKKYSFKLYLSNKSYNFLDSFDYNMFSFFPPVMLSNIKNLNLDNTKICRDNDIINWNDHKIKVIESPGHSPDCLMLILDENKIVFTGDTIFHGSIGRTDLPGGNYEEIINSINKLFNIIDEDYTLYPGHGPKTSVEFEKKYNPFIKNLNYLKK